MASLIPSSLINFAEHVIPFLIVLTILVFVHELGHYLVARYNKVKIEVFSIGFGPELFGWNDKARTRWKVSMIPLGGYVKFFGDADASSRPDTESLESMSAEDKSSTLHSKPVGQRMAVSAAGPFANFLFAIVVLAGLYMVKGEPFIPATVGAVAPGKLAEKAGLKEGDKILKLNDVSVSDFHALRKVIVNNKGKEVDIRISRDNQEQVIHVKMVETVNGVEKPVGVLGIGPTLPEYRDVNPLSAITHAVGTTWTASVDTLIGIGQMISGKRSADEMGGILMIGDLAGKSAKGGVAALLVFMAFLSINLGLINLLPIPVLDGGHILFYGIEAIVGKPVPEKIQEYAFMVGLAIVVSVMLLTTWNDVVRFILN
ncbi:MAG: RIP metalloprotease RseP [Alphaproteobacteria bacterium]|jgi:regulator of sigma E protease|nr:RIP metalloprotease RseP [Alphaproteobacteria bacterium]